MSTSLLQSTTATHPQPITPEGVKFFCENVTRDLLATPSAGDQKIIDRKHDIRKGFNRVADTLTQFMVHSYKEGKPIHDQLVKTIGDFFSTKIKRVRRGLSDLFQAETKEEGELNLVQMAIAQGDRSTPMLIRLITEIDEIVPLLLEIRDCAVAEVHQRAEPPRGTSSNG